MSYVTTNVRLDPEVYRDLQTRALAQGISLAEAIRRALRQSVAGWRGEAREGPTPYRATVEGPERSVADPIVELAAVRLRGAERVLVLPAPEGLPPDAMVLVSIMGPVTEEHVEGVRAHKARLDAWARQLDDIPASPVRLSDEDREIYR